MAALLIVEDDRKTNEAICKFARYQNEDYQTGFLPKKHHRKRKEI